MEILYKEEVYTIVGHCIEAWKNLGYGFSEVIYKDAMEVEFISGTTPYLREVELPVIYKEVLLRHRFRPDFLVFGKIIIEVKSGDDAISDAHVSQILNYLKVSGCRIGLLINFVRSKATYRRFIV